MSKHAESELERLEDQDNPTLKNSLPAEQPTIFRFFHQPHRISERTTVLPAIEGVKRLYQKLKQMLEYRKEEDGILSTPGIDRVIGIPNHRLPVCYRSILGDEARADELVPATYRLYPGY